MVGLSSPSAFMISDCLLKGCLQQWMFPLIGASLSLAECLEVFTRWLEQKWSQAILNKNLFPQLCRDFDHRIWFPEVLHLTNGPNKSQLMRRTSWRNNCSVAVNRRVLHTVVETIGDICVFLDLLSWSAGHWRCDRAYRRSSWVLGTFCCLTDKAACKGH